MSVCKCVHFIHACQYCGNFSAALCINTDILVALSQKYDDRLIVKNDRMMFLLKCHQKLKGQLMQPLLNQGGALPQHILSHLQRIGVGEWSVQEPGHGTSSQIKLFPALFSHLHKCNHRFWEWRS